MKWLYNLRGKPKHCGKCASELETTRKAIGFNRKTGKLKKVGVWVGCPDYRNWVTCDNGHDLYYWSEGAKHA